MSWVYRFDDRALKELRKCNTPKTRPVRTEFGDFVHSAFLDECTQRAKQEKGKS